MFDICVMSCNRQNNYIDNLIYSFKSSSNNSLNIFVDGSSEYLNKYNLDDKIKINRQSDDEISLLKDTSVFQKMAINYKRCLNFGYSNTGILIVEDDIIFAQGWESRLSSYIKDIKNTHENFILSLFTTHTIFLESNKFYYKNEKEFGGVAIYYTEGIKNDFIDYMNKYNSPHAHNIILSKFIIEKHVPTYVTVPCLVEHCGTKSTWNKSPYTNKAIYFNKELCS